MSNIWCWSFFDWCLWSRWIEQHPLLTIFKDSIVFFIKNTGIDWLGHLLCEEPKFRGLLCCKLLFVQRKKKRYFPKHRTCCEYSESCLRHQRGASVVLVSSLLGRLWAARWQPSGASAGSHLGNVSWNSDSDSLSPLYPLPGTSPGHARLTGSWLDPAVSMALALRCENPTENRDLWPCSTEYRSVQPLPLFVCSPERPEPCTAPGISELRLVTGRVLTKDW